MLFGVWNFSALHDAYVREDRRLLKYCRWDAIDSDLFTNKAKIILERMDPNHLKRDEREWRAEILWFWYHHATNWAICNFKDQQMALSFVRAALSYQDECKRAHDGRQNRITRLLWFLLNGNLKQAEGHILNWPANAGLAERDTAIRIVRRYLFGEFFSQPAAPPNYHRHYL